MDRTSLTGNFFRTSHFARSFTGILPPPPPPVNPTHRFDLESSKIALMKLTFAPTSNTNSTLSPFNRYNLLPSAPSQRTPFPSQKSARIESGTVDRNQETAS